MRAKKIQTLTAKQARYLRGLGHHLKPVVYLGRKGIDKELLASLEAVLIAHELVKVKVGNNCELDRKEAATVLAQKSGAAVAQVLGKTFLLYRENPDKEADKKITLPG
jgi:RNA-binding protein